MNWFDRAVSEGVNAGVRLAMADAAKPGGAMERAVRRMLPGAVSEAMKSILRKMAHEDAPPRGSLTEAGFAWQMAFHFLRTDPTMDVFDARDLAFETLREFLKMERVEFGHPDYSWDRSGAIDVATEMETDHWESLQ